MIARRPPPPSGRHLPPSHLPLSARKNLGFLPPPPALLPNSRVFSSRPITASSHRHERPKPNRADQDQHRGERGEEDDQQLRCEVDVISWRERRIKAWVLVHADVDSVWAVLTDYEMLAEFIPNLVYSGTIPCPHQGRIWLEQRGLQRALYWHIEARVVLDLQEFPDLDDGCELHFSMVDGDFKKFEGKWSVKAGPRSSTAILSYEVNVIPTYNFPAIFLERIICSDLPLNLRALACRAEQKIMIDSERGGTLDIPFTSLETKIRSSNKFEESNGASGIKIMPTSHPAELTSKWGVFGNVCRLDRPCMVDEVHLRRYDGLLENGGTQRCVIASITVKASVREVWNVLTSYEELPEIVPNLAISKIILRDNNKVRILQEGCKGLLYMVLHARVVLDLHEKHEREICFEQVEGDFDSFQGKWLLERLGNHHTLLKYIVETKMHKDTFLSDAIVEEVIYEDLPSNLCAIRDSIEKREAANTDQLKDPNPLADDLVRVEDSRQESTSHVSNLLIQRPKVPGLQRNLETLKAEIMAFISEYGQEGFMPMRKHLRLHGRVDIEKAITRMGGFRKIACLMNLSLAYKHRKPKGYWDNLENLQEEISRFQRNWGMDPVYMPSRKSFERAGRYDIARALEKWGGLQEVSRLLSLELRHLRRRPNAAMDQHCDSRASDDGPADDESTGIKPCVSQDTQKWLLKLKDLDIGWVE